MGAHTILPSSLVFQKLGWERVRRCNNMAGSFLKILIGQMRVFTSSPIRNGFAAIHMFLLGLVGNVTILRSVISIKDPLVVLLLVHYRIGWQINTTIQFLAAVSEIQCAWLGTDTALVLLLWNVREPLAMASFSRYQILSIT